MARAEMPMSTTFVEPLLAALRAQPVLFHATVEAVGNALAMCNGHARCVGVSSVPPREVGHVTGMIGVHGKVSGFITVNMAERFAVRTVEGLLEDRFGELTPQVVDGVAEITNIIGGGIKAALAATPWAFPHVTVPSVIVGQRYQIAFAKGMEFLCTTFEQDDPDSFALDDRVMQVSVSFSKV
jgi:chemotaxis protein CheX